MYPIRAGFLLTLLWLLGGSARDANAQALQTGRWTGYMGSPGGELFEIDVRIEPSGDSLDARMLVNGWDRGFFLHGMELRRDLLTYYWLPSFKADCRLQREPNGTFLGSCLDPWGLLGPVVMVPPGMEAREEMLDPARAARTWQKVAGRAAMEDVDERLGEPVDIGGHELNLHATGDGEVTVVLEAGLGDHLRTWDYVQLEAAEFARVVSYDRAGLGYSDPGPAPRSPVRIAMELHSALEKAGIGAPFVVVGHALGAVFARTFASLYPDEVVGMVLVDPDHEAQGKRWRALDPASWDNHWNQRQMLYGLAPEAVRAEFELYRQMIDDGRAPGVGPLPEIPTVIISPRRPVPEPRWVGETPEGQRARSKLHQAWADQTQKARLVVTTTSGSYVHREDPDLVLDAIREVVEAVE